MFRVFFLILLVPSVLASAQDLEVEVEVQGQRVEVSSTDPRGGWLQLREPPLPGLVPSTAADTTGRLDASFWDLELETIEGEAIRMSSLKGQYVLLNFWGEWCAPCLGEIPTLVATDETYEDGKIQLISLLYTDDLPAAREVIDREGMAWPQVLYLDSLTERFRVRSWPTNILILPDGETYVRRNGVTRVFFDQFLN